MRKINGVYTAFNGMDLSKSRSNPNSRYNKILDYLKAHGASTKARMMYDIFGLVTEDNKAYNYYPTNNHKIVTRGWGTYVWTLMVLNGELVKTRIGNRVVYTVGKPIVPTEPDLLPTEVLERHTTFIKQHTDILRDLTDISKAIIGRIEKLEAAVYADEELRGDGMPDLGRVDEGIEKCAHCEKYWNTEDLRIDIDDDWMCPNCY
jgi:hypothetical protein